MTEGDDAPRSERRGASRREPETSRRSVRDEMRARLEQSPSPVTVRLTRADIDRMTAALVPERSLAPPQMEEMMLQALADGLFFREQQQRGATVLLRQPDGTVEKVVLR